MGEDVGCSASRRWGYSLVSLRGWTRMHGFSLNALNENLNSLAWWGEVAQHLYSISHVLLGRPFSPPVVMLWTHNTSLMDEACYGLDSSLLTSLSYSWWNLFHVQYLGSELNKNHGLEGRRAFISLLHSYHHAEDVWGWFYTDNNLLCWKLTLPKGKKCACKIAPYKMHYFQCIILSHTCKWWEWNICCQ